MIDSRKHVTSYKYALAGIKYAFIRDQNLRIHFIVAIFVIIFGLFFQVNAFEMGILGITILLVICAEMINSAIEQMVDLITTEHRKEAAIAKDLSAGMVLLTVLGAVIIGIWIFSPYIINLLLVK